MSYIGQIFIYTKAKSDFDILCSEFEPPKKHERVEVALEMELSGFPFYRLKLIDREGYQYFDMARPLLKYYITQGSLVHPPPEDHTGMVRGYDGKWRWL